MRIGLSLNSTFPGTSPHDVVARLIARTRIGADAGLDFLTIGDRHALAVPYAQNVPTLARLAAEWPADPDRPIGCLFLLPLWNPVLVAEQVGTLAGMHPGRFVIQTGIGSGRDQFSAMNARHGTRGRDLERAVGLIDRLLSGEEVTDERFGITAARVGLVPDLRPEWWMGGGVDLALERVARLEASIYVNPGSVEQATDVLRRFAAACDRQGHHPHRRVVRQDTFVAADGRAAERTVTSLVERGYRGMTVADIAHGSPEAVAERFARLGEMGATDIAVRQVAVDEADVLRSLELMGEVRRLLA